MIFKPLPFPGPFHSPRKIDKFHETPRTSQFINLEFFSVFFLFQTWTWQPINTEQVYIGSTFTSNHNNNYNSISSSNHCAAVNEHNSKHCLCVIKLIKLKRDNWPQKDLSIVIYNGSFVSLLTRMFFVYRPPIFFKSKNTLVYERQIYVSIGRFSDGLLWDMYH